LSGQKAKYQNHVKAAKGYLSANLNILWTYSGNRQPCNWSPSSLQWVLPILRHGPPNGGQHPLTPGDSLW